MADLFDDTFFDDLFGESSTPAAEPKKAPENKGVKKTATKSSKPSKPVNTYNVPLKVNTGYSTPFTLNADAFGGKETGISPDEVKASLEKIYPYFQKDHVDLSRVSETECCIGIRAADAQAKGTIKITENTRAYLGQVYVPTTNFLKEADGTEISVEEFGKDVIPAITCKVVVGDNILSLIPGTDLVSSGTKVDLPVEVCVLQSGLKKLTFTAEDFKEESDEDEEGEAAPAPVTKASAYELEKKLEERVPDFKNGLRLASCVKDGKTTAYVVRYEAKSAGPVTAAKKEATYKVGEGLVISLLFKRYNTTSADFSGKTEVTVKDIAGYLRSQGELEYEDDKTQVVNYNEEKNTVVVAFRGGTKG